MLELSIVTPLRARLSHEEPEAGNLQSMNFVSDLRQRKPSARSYLAKWCDMRKARTIAFLLAAATSIAVHKNGALAETQPCRSMEYERNAYTICEIHLRKHTVRLYWKRSGGTPYAYLSALPRALEGEAGRLLFATNAGMFDPALKPVGLYVERGRELVHVNTKSGYGNFHMKPNGIFSSRSSPPQPPSAPPLRLATHPLPSRRVEARAARAARHAPRIGRTARAVAS